MNNDRRTPPLDTSIEIITPENAAFTYRVAGPARRLPAYLIDMVVIYTAAIIVCLLILLVMASIGLEGVGLGVTLVIFFLTAWFYLGFCEAYFNGQTLGKRMLKIRVISEDGQPINALQAILRNVLRVADLLPGLYQVGFLFAISNDRFQRLGDIACGTMVVFEEENWARPSIKFDDPMVQQLAAQLPNSYRAEPSLVRALSLYIQRRKNLTPQRRIEIARHVGTPLIERFQLSPRINPDLLLCALYHKTFADDTV